MPPVVLMGSEGELLQGGEQRALAADRSDAEGSVDLPVEGDVSREYRRVDLSFDVSSEADEPLRETVVAAGGACDQIWFELHLRCPKRYSTVRKQGEFIGEDSSALGHDLLSVVPALIDEVAAPDDVDASTAQETNDAVAPVRPEVDRVQCDLLVPHCFARLHEG